MLADHLEALVDTPAFRARARRAAAMIRSRESAGEEWTFEEVARELELPVEVVLLGFQHAIASRLGLVIIPTVTSQ